MPGPRSLSHPAAALLLVGHGTRDPQGLAEFGELVALVRRLQPQWRVAGCFLELARPSLFEALEQLVEQGVRRITVLPLLLFAAGHAKRDIPTALAAISATHPQVEIHLASHLGCQDRVLAASAAHYEAAARAASESPAQDTLLVFVGRGSYDASARAESLRFAELRRRLTPVGHLRVAYLAMAEPRVDDVLRAAGELRFPRVIVQPHLLFAGELLAELRRLVAEYAAQYPWQHWVLADHLGASRALAEAVVEIAAARQLLELASPKR